MSNQILFCFLNRDICRFNSTDRMISDFAGHKDISTTQKYYIHSVTPLTDKADVFAEVFKPKAV